MLKQQARLLFVSVFLVDLGLVAAAFLVSFWLRDTVLPSVRPDLFPSHLYPLASYLPLLPVALGVWAVALIATGRYESHRTVTLLTEAQGLVKACITGAVLFAVSIFAFRLDFILPAPDRISRSWILLFVLTAIVLLLAEKIALRVLSRYVRHQGYNYRTVLIVGVNESARRIASSLLGHEYWGFKLLGFVRSDGEHKREHFAGYPVLGELGNVLEVVNEHVVDDVFFSLPRRNLSQLEEVFLSLQQQGIRTRFALDVLPHGSASIEVEELDGLPMLSVSPTPDNMALLFFKRPVDVALSMLLLSIGLPVIVVVAIALKRTSSGSVLYRQTRCGLNGRRFTLYKFRTMVEDADTIQKDLEHLNEMDGPVFKVRQDPRVTRLGRFLRKFSLDELPQLWNVLRGDMSLVGPRPPIPEEVVRYSRWQRRRLSMKPGLTCLWQISGRNNLDFERWIELDLEYIDSWSPGLDFKILLKTIPAVLSGKGAF